jgi:acyl-CoA thioester hydrolase
MSEQPSGPFGAELIRTQTRTVPPEWIDYNGHMNVAFYTRAFDLALDELLEAHLGVGATFVAEARMGPYVLQNHLHYLAELREGEGFFVEVLMLDCDPKRLHVFLTMRAAETGALAATSEQMVMNVDLESRRSAPYPDWAQSRMRALAEAQARLDRPDQIGRPLGIRRR